MATTENPLDFDAMNDPTSLGDGATQAALVGFGRQFDTVASSVAAIAVGQRELLGRLAEAETKRRQDALELGRRLEAVEGVLLNLGLADRLEDILAAHQEHQATLQHLSERTAALTTMLGELVERPVAASPVARPARPLPEVIVPDVVTLPLNIDADLAPLRGQLVDLAATAAHQRDDLARVADAVATLGARPSDLAAMGPVIARVNDLTSAVQSISGQLPQLGDNVTHRLTEHTDTALAGVLRLLDGRLAALRRALADAGSPSTSATGETPLDAETVMGIAQASWNHLEQRIDTEFDDLGRQLQAMAALIEAVVVSNEDLASRPIVTGEQFRRAATSVKETVVTANRNRRQRRGGPKSLDS